MKPPAAPIPHPHVEARRSRIIGLLGRAVKPIGGDGGRLTRERARYLLNEAEDLYWNELAWEELTEEERVGGGPLTELVFPGLLAFVDGLLVHGEDGPGETGSGPHPDIVENILVFLADQHATMVEKIGRGADSGNLVRARAMTAELIDLVLYRLYGLTRDEREELEASA